MRWVQIICFTLVSWFAATNGALSRKVHVSPQGAEGPDCVNTTCSLHYAFHHEAGNSTEILISPGTYHLENLTTFANLTDFALVRDGPSGLVNITCNGTHGGLAFEFCENILLEGITLFGCGSLHNSTVGTAFGSRAHIAFYSAIFVVYTNNFSMNQWTIAHSPGIGLNMYDVGGVVTIENSTFKNNGPVLNCSELPIDIALAGGGVYVEFTASGGLPPFNSHPGEYDRNNTYRFTECTFRKNSAPKPCNATEIEIPHGEDHFPFGRGGGLSIFVKGEAQNNTIEVTNCTFVKNHALWGAGFFLEFQDQTENNMLTILRSKFTRNNCIYAGGGTRTGLIVDRKGKLKKNELMFKDCTFTNNSASMGGGVSHYQFHYQPVDANDTFRMSITFDRCTWKRNTATMGSAINLASDTIFNGLEQVDPDFIFTVPYWALLRNCLIHNNHIVIQDANKMVIGQGALYIAALPTVFSGNTCFVANNQTAVLLDNSVLRVHGHVNFSSNTGNRGGALSIYGQSKLVLMPNSELHFLGNKADEKGGAIFVQRPGPPVVSFDTTELMPHGCFIWYDNNPTLSNMTYWMTKMIFEDNRAPPGGGQSIYAATLEGCRKAGEPRMKNTALEWNNFTEYRSAGGQGREIATDPIIIGIEEQEWNVAPGEVFNATIRLSDEKNNSVLGVVELDISPNGVKLDAPSPLLLVHVDESLGNGKITNLKLRGGENESFQLSLRTVSGQVVRKRVQGKLYLKNCYPGFQIQGDKCECLNATDYDGIEGCGEDGKTVKLKPGFWGGKVNRKFVVSPCPLHYCNDSTTKGVFAYDGQSMCIKNRNQTSVLCGECKTGYSVNLGDEDCSQRCRWDHLWFLLLFCVATLIVVLIVLRMNMDIFTTYLNAWLYSYQVILLLLDEGQKLDPFINFIIRLPNWQIAGVSSCIYHRMNDLHKHGVNYILPAYVLALLVILGKVARRWPSCYVNRNVYRAFCTLLVLCYTDVTAISFKLLHWVKLDKKWYLFIDGNIEFYHDWKKHLPFTIVAVVWIVFFVIPIPVMLLFTPTFLRRFRYLQNFRLYFDNFQHCFKVQYRWFAAFYFICRIYMLLVAMYVPVGSMKWTALEVSNVLIVVICVYIQPYNERYTWLNRLDAVLLTNICCITIFSSPQNKASAQVENHLGAIVHILAYVPLVYFIVLLMYSGWNFFCPQDMPAYDLQENSKGEDEDTEPTLPLESHYGQI